MKKRAPTIILLLTFFAGLCLLLYPAVSDFVNQKRQSRAIEAHSAAVFEMTPEEKNAYFSAAVDYNNRLFNMQGSFYNADDVSGYDDLLNISGNGIMGYVGIEKIRVELPIYHGTSNSILNNAAGHLKGSSLPVGGENTHCVISAHRGLPSAKLFTDLDKLEVGDVFTITVADEVLTYEIDRIRTVDPHDVKELLTEQGKDYCTLLTCTPYGINTHRLLARGRRIENIKEKARLFVTPDAYRIDVIIAAPAVAAPMLLILIIRLMIPHKKRKKFQYSDIISKSLL